MNIEDLETAQDCKKFLEMYIDLLDRCKMPKMKTIYQKKIEEIREKQEELKIGVKKQN